MGERQLKRLYAVALNIEAAATSIQCSPSLLKNAIDRGELAAYANPVTGAKRIVVEDLVEWVRSTWKRATYRTEGVPNDRHT